jgi:hypothetical protein
LGFFGKGDFFEGVWSFMGRVFWRSGKYLKMKF